ncbi:MULTISPECIES: LytR/AlgR family response regulator transcription factor [unclassified Rhodococcus (in: high G+C Gram-positive bacteria)]|uniref:LytR/AlgR family response regulator transcription factor n=1 Tax=unclassified Rhodococcus (in: high G+C Gram-positive bacteria) TaxID=192944 RepID=UPI0003722E19|nr:response regulator transcription factor [Rhodococcus sp. DK17]
MELMVLQLGRLRCLIVDDSPRFSDTARRLLEQQDITVVGTASNTADAVRAAAELHPDVILVDVELGAESGFDLAQRLDDRAHPSAVILISTHAEQDLAELISGSPAVGFVSKSDLSSDAIRDVLRAGNGTEGERVAPVSGPRGR